MDEIKPIVKDDTAVSKPLQSIPSCIAVEGVTDAHEGMYITLYENL